MLRLDQQLSQAIPSLRNETFTQWVIFVTNLNGVIGASLFTVVFSAYLVFKKYYKEFTFYLVSFLFASGLFEVIKLCIERIRPEVKIINELGYSFPSGHSSMSMTIALSVYLIFVTKIHFGAGRKLLLLGCILWPLLIVFTRLYLNVHWLSDTLAGMSIGIFCTTLVYMWIFHPKHLRVNEENMLKD